MNPDPDFPDRPDHPDFWKLSAAVCANDAEADAGIPTVDIIAAVVDPASLKYMMDQRVGRANQLLPGGAEPTTTWLDGFMAGVRYAEQNVPQDGNRRQGVK
jgi:hypothetical protein